jgi:hypothetical protein
LSPDGASVLAALPAGEGPQAGDATVEVSVDGGALYTPPFAIKIAGAGKK